MFSNPDEDSLRKLLQDVRTIAIVGASPNPERPSHYIGEFLKARGYRVIPVHPAIATLFGETAYPTLSAVPERIELANFYINSARVGPLVDEAVQLGIGAIWIQDHVEDEAAAERASQAGAKVVMNDCIYRRHRQLII